MKSLIPNGVSWKKEAVSTFNPDNDSVRLANGEEIGYRALVAAPGLKLNWAGIEGLDATLGKNGVTSNYRYDLAAYWKGMLKGHEWLVTPKLERQPLPQGAAASSKAT